MPIRFMAAAALIAALAAPALAANQQDWDDCKGDDIERSITGCTRVISDRSESLITRAQAYNYRGNAWGRKNEWDKAIADYTEAIALDPQFARAYSGRGVAWREKGELDKAVVDYTEAIRLEPNTPDYYNYRAVAWNEKREFDKAIADCNEAIRLEPKFSRAYYNRAYALREKGDLDKAIPDFNEAIRLDPRFARAYYFRGLVWIDKNDLDKAIADFDQAVKFDTTDPRYFNSRGLALRDKGDLARAIADFGEAIKLRPNGPAYHFNRGLTYTYGGSPVKGLADFYQAYDLNPGYAYNALWVDIVAQRTGVASKLAQAAQRFDLSKWPGPVVRLYLGQSTPAAVLAAADAPDAKTKRDRLCDANFYNGVWELRQGGKDRAAELFRAAAADCPRNFDERFAAEAELKQLGK